MKTYMTQRRLDATCPLCLTIHTDLPVERDEDGGYVEIETEPCHDDECTRKLCSCCPQFTCECCDLAFCLQANHIGIEDEPECTCVQTDVDQVDARGCAQHGTRYPKTKYWCRVCAAPEEMEIRIEPAPELAPLIAQEVA